MSTSTIGGMRRLHRPNAFVLVLFATVLGMGGCSTMGPPEPPGASVRASFGNMGIISVGPMLGPTVLGPVSANSETGRGALKGAEIGGLSGVGAGVLGSFACGPFFPACAIVFGTIAGVGGLVVGAGTGAVVANINADAKTLERIESSLSEAIADHDLQAELRSRVLQRSHAMGIRGVSDLGASQFSEAPAMPDYSQYLSQDVQTILEIGISQIALTGDSSRNPTLVLSVNVRARLIRMSDNKVLWTNEQMSTKSQAADYSVWIQNDSGLLDSEIERGIDTLAREIGVAVFQENPSKVTVLAN
jgi:hypothetical protein